MAFGFLAIFPALMGVCRVAAPPAAARLAVGRPGCPERRCCNDVQRADSRHAACRRLPGGDRYCERKLTSEGSVHGPSLRVASSGIGKEFAPQIAASGKFMSLWSAGESLCCGRSALNATRASGVQHRIIPLDLSEPDFLPGACRLPRSDSSTSALSSPMPGTGTSRARFLEA